MSYQVLARKWRPRSFATLVGQEHVVKALTHALEQQRLHHAYLFTGTRGVGKTTIARILAKCLNCEMGITPAPCGQCPSCQEIDGGRFVDLIEVDAATNTRVEEMRQLLDNATYAPTRGRYKVYVIDEVHMLSNSAFNSMLKTLEEPPEHIKFILATTDPQKIPVTVLSRCLQFNLKQMPPQAIVEHLGRVLEHEAIPFEPSALRALAKAANGSMRDALSLLDQAIAFGAGQVLESNVREMLGTVGEDHLFALLDGLREGDLGAMLACAETLAARSLDFAAALQDLASLIHRIALLRLAPQAIADEQEKTRLAPYAAAFDDEFLQLCWQIVLHGRQELALAPDEYAGFTMTLLRLHAFRPMEAAPLLVAPLSGAQNQTTDRRPERQPATSSTKPVEAVANHQQSEMVTETSWGAESVRSVSSAVEATPLGHDSTLDWPQLAVRLPLVGLPRQLAQRCELAEFSGERMVLRLAPQHAHLADRKADVDRLQAALSSHFGRPIALRLMIAETAGATPKEREIAERQARLDAAIAAFESDPFVREAIERFDASIIESSIKPI